MLEAASDKCYVFSCVRKKLYLERREIKSYVWSGVIKKAVLGVGLDKKPCFEQCKRESYAWSGVR